jgi:orotate phosphoribosyltransferase
MIDQDLAEPMHAELVRLLRTRSFRRGEFTLASGRTSPYYVDARPTTMSARGLFVVGQLGLRAIRGAGWDATLIGGLTLGADPVAYAVARASLDAPPLLDAFTVRKAAKQHGTGRRIEGVFAAGARVVIAEDVITTGSSALEAVHAVREAGGIVAGILAVVDREEGGRDALEHAGIPVTALVLLSELTASA